jgi:hypothetical protein
MTRIRSRWHDAGVLGVSPGTPGKQAAAGFALYGLRLQAEGISPGPIEATITITDKHGHLVGQLDLDARDAQWMVEAISGMLNLVYGPWRAEDVDRLLADYGPARQARDHRHNPHQSASSPDTETSAGRSRRAVGGRSLPSWESSHR